jgi:Pyruvate/2-oxoacid:ferredoxin oxidoreductase delta subunit
VLATHNERVSITDTILQVVIKFVYGSACEICISLCCRPSVQSTQCLPPHSESDSSMSNHLAANWRILGPTNQTPTAIAVNPPPIAA